MKFLKPTWRKCIIAIIVFGILYYFFPFGDVFLVQAIFPPTMDNPPCKNIHNLCTAPSPTMLEAVEGLLILYFLPILISYAIAILLDFLLIQKTYRDKQKNAPHVHM